MNTIAVISFLRGKNCFCEHAEDETIFSIKKRNAYDILAFSYFTSISQTRIDRRLRIATGFRGFKNLSGFFEKLKSVEKQLRYARPKVIP